MLLDKGAITDATGQRCDHSPEPETVCSDARAHAGSTLLAMYQCSSAPAHRIGTCKEAGAARLQLPVCRGPSQGLGLPASSHDQHEAGSG